MMQMVPLTTVPRRVKLRIEDYLALDDAGAFAAYGKTELLDGEVVYMNAQHRPHARYKSRLFRLLAERLDALDCELEALVESSIAMPPSDVPEPDIALTSEPEGEGLIPLSSLRLIVEVADTTLRNDLGGKLAIYAAAKVAEYWVLDIGDAVVHQMWAPHDDDYAERRRIPLSARITAATIPGLTVDLSRL